MSTIRNMVLASGAALLFGGAVIAPAQAEPNPYRNNGTIAACDKQHRCVTRDGRYLQVDVRAPRREKVIWYSSNDNPTFLINDVERPTLRYGNNGFIGQQVYWGLGGPRTQLGDALFDNLR